MDTILTWSMRLWFAFIVLLLGWVEAGYLMAGGVSAWLDLYAPDNAGAWVTRVLFLAPGLLALWLRGRLRHNRLLDALHRAQRQGAHG